MQFKSAAALLAALSPAVMGAMPLCDKYTTALLMDNTAKNQYTLLTLLVNTVVIGNYTTPNHNAVPGILTPGTYMGEKVNLLPYFDGSLKSTNLGGVAGVQNFLDGGGAAPLMKSMPADDKTSAQYMLLTHLYEFFGTLLGCSKMGTTAFPAYAGTLSQYEVHRFMALDSAQVGYFIQNVGLAATSFGVTAADVKTVATALTTIFDVRCAPAVSLGAGIPKALQSICTDSDCELAPDSDCSAYAPVVMPMPANGTSPAPSGTGAVSSSAAATSAPSSSAAASPSSSPAPSPPPASSATGFIPSIAAVLAFAGLALAL